MQHLHRQCLFRQMIRAEVEGCGGMELPFVASVEGVDTDVAEGDSARADALLASTLGAFFLRVIVQWGRRDATRL